MVFVTVIIIEDETSVEPEILERSAAQNAAIGEYQAAEKQE